MGLRSLPERDELEADGVEAGDAGVLGDELADLRRDVGVLQNGQRLILGEIAEVLGDEGVELVTGDGFEVVEAHRDG